MITRENVMSKESMTQHVTSQKTNGIDIMLAINSIAEQYHITKREKEVILAIILHGYSNKDLGEYLYISETTIKNHVSSILYKTNTGSTRRLLSMVLQELLATDEVV